MLYQLFTVVDMSQINKLWLNSDLSLTLCEREAAAHISPTARLAARDKDPTAFSKQNSND